MSGELYKELLRSPVPTRIRVQVRRRIALGIRANCECNHMRLSMPSFRAGAIVLEFYPN